jgi:acylphosphatase
VRNLPDGRVELLAEGEETELNGFLAAVRERMDRYIKDVEIERGQASGLYTLFEIAYTS